MANFKDCTVVITGASTGIGAAAARAFAKRGARIVLAARSAAPLQELADAITAEGGQALAVPTDVSDIAACERLISAALDRFGSIDVLVNNAGANRRGSIEDHSAAELAQVVHVNLVAPIVLTRLALPHLRKSSVASVINVASLAGRVPLPHEAVYSATKFGLRAFSIAMAEELADSPVRMSVVSPGPVDTGFILDEIDTVPDLVFSQPMSTAEDISDLIVACAEDGRMERMRPRMGGYLATVGYVFPTLRRFLVPVLERRGRKHKADFIARNKAATEK